MDSSPPTGGESSGGGVMPGTEGKPFLRPYAERSVEVIRDAGDNVLSKCAAVVREAGVEADASMKIIETLGLRIHDAIEEEATRLPADLIVIGTHGRRGFRHMLLGSVAEGVVRIATKSVLLIRGK